MTRRIRPARFALALALLAPAASAEQVFNEDVIVNGALCAGGECAAGETFPDAPVKIKAFSARIHFDDASPSGQNDWLIEANELLSGGDSLFAISDLTSGTRPFTLFAGAPTNSLFVDGAGQVGLGTALPQQELHVLSDDGNAGIRLEEVQGTTGIWDIRANNVNFWVRDSVNSTAPFVIEDGAPNYALDIGRNGDIGLGTSQPEGKLHTQGGGTQKIYFESSNGGAV